MRTYTDWLSHLQYLLEERVRDLYSGDYEGRGTRSWKVGQKPEKYHNIFGWGWMHGIKERGTIHLIDSDFIDPDTLREFAETFYRWSKFTVSGRALYALADPDYWGFGFDVDSLVTHMELYARARSRTAYVENVKNQARVLRYYVENKKTAAILTIRMDYFDDPLDRDYKKNVFPFIRAWVDHCFATLDELLSAGHKVFFQIAPGHKFQIKSKELTVECWMEKFRGCQW
jgi:hypothetical protein